MKKEKALLVSVLGLVLFFEIIQTIQINKRMKSSKEEIQELAQNSIEAVKNGEASGLETYIDARKQAEYYTKLADALKEFAIKEREKCPEKRLQMNGAVIELSYSGDRLDYDTDTIHKQLNQALKQRQKELKEAFKCDNTIVDCDGVEVPKVGVKTHGKQIIKVSY